MEGICDDIHVTARRFELYYLIPLFLKEPLIYYNPWSALPCINKRGRIVIRFFYKEYRKVAKSNLTIAKKPKAPPDEFLHFYLLNGLKITF